MTAPVGDYGSILGALIFAQEFVLLIYLLMRAAQDAEADGADGPFAQNHESEADHIAAEIDDNVWMTTCVSFSTSLRAKTKASFRESTRSTTG